MTARPGNWTLLDHSSDPVAGDSAAVHSAATYYSSMAETIKEEANRLKTLGQDGELVGKYAKSLQEELGDLSDEVDKAHQRYEAVGAALKPYAKALDDALAESWGALNDAVTADAALSKANAQPTATATDGKPLTEAQKTANSSKTTAVGHANDALNAAKKRLSTALSDLNDAGKKAAGEINDGSNDSLKDHHHWWDVVVKIIKVVVEILNYVVIVLAVAALFVTGLGEIIFILSAAILALDLLLYATGNASLTDVIIDVIGLATCGISKGAVKGSEMAAESATKAAIKTAAREAADGKGYGFIRRAWYATELTGDATSKVAGVTSKATKGLEGPEKAVAGLEALSRQFPNSAQIGRRLAAARALAKTDKVAGVVGLTATAGNTALSPSNIPGLENVKPYNHQYNDYKESRVPEERSGHAYDFKWNTLHYSPSSLLETAGPRAN